MSIKTILNVPDLPSKQCGYDDVSDIYILLADIKEVSVNQCNNLGNILCKLPQNTARVLGHVDKCADLSTSHARSVRDLNENKTIIQT